MSEFTDKLRLHDDERLYQEADDLLCDAANHIDHTESALDKAHARIARLEEVQVMYCARRHAAYLMRRKLQMSGICLTESAFIAEYDEASQRYVCGIDKHLVDDQ